ncbi:MAG: hypothetical protein ACI8XB_001906 [Patiriisocius sp.]|jgi:hypothetical protein
MAFSSCIKEPVDEEYTVLGMKPLYLESESFNDIYAQDAKPFERVGKIYRYGQFIYISDRGTGVHIINNVDPYNPQKVTFINIPGNFDMLSRQDVLYADNNSDLITLDISNLHNISVVDRINDVYPNNGFFDYPQFYNGPFECVDPDKGLVYDWEEAYITNPKCQRQ